MGFNILVYFLPEWVCLFLLPFRSVGTSQYLFCLDLQPLPPCQGHFLANLSPLCVFRAHLFHVRNTVGWKEAGGKPFLQLCSRLAYVYLLGLLLHIALLPNCLLIFSHSTCSFPYTSYYSIKSHQLIGLDSLVVSNSN